MLFLLLVLVGLFLFESILTRRFVVPDRMKRVSTGMDRLLLFVPMLAVLVFAVLFLFVLKGRLYERVSHAVLVLALWLYAARFYWMLLSFFKHRIVLLMSIPGMAGSVAAAIVLTPLDRYADMIHSFTGAGSILVGCGLLAIYCAAPFLFPRKTGKNEQATAETPRKETAHEQ